MVQIDEHDRECRATRDRRVDTLAEEGAIGEACQWVVLGEKGEPRLRLLLRRHILKGTTPAAFGARLVSDLEHPLPKRHFQAARGTRLPGVSFVDQHLGLLLGHVAGFGLQADEVWHCHAGAYPRAV